MISRANQARNAPLGGFTLTDAIRPGRQSQLEPIEGYRIERFRDPVSRKRMPLLAVAASSERLFDLFIALLEPLGETVNMVLETSHGRSKDQHDDMCRSDIDLPVLISHLYDSEEMLLNDGCAGVAVLAQERAIEVQLDEHKLIYVYADDLKPFRRILKAHGIRRIDDMRLIAESEHVHLSTPELADEFNELCLRIGAGDLESAMTDENEWSGW